MTEKYEITGMTCQNCVKKVRAKINALADISHSHVQLNSPQLVMETAKPISVEKIRAALPSYTVKSLNPTIEHATEKEESFISTYKPLLMIVAFIAGVSLLAQYPFLEFSWMLFMRHFMAGFFIVFAFFKLLNLEGFANSYAMYDILAGRWKTWGYIYPFLELALGIAYLVNMEPQLIGIITILLLSIGSIGVIKSNLDKRTIQCACLGDVFNLPMSVVTIIENVVMLIMASLMLLA